MTEPRFPRVEDVILQRDEARRELAAAKIELAAYGGLTPGQVRELVSAHEELAALREEVINANARALQAFHGYDERRVEVENAALREELRIARRASDDWCRDAHALREENARLRNEVDDALAENVRLTSDLVAKHEAYTVLDRCHVQLRAQLAAAEAHVAALVQAGHALLDHLDERPLLALLNAPGRNR